MLRGAHLSDQTMTQSHIRHSGSISAEFTRDDRSATPLAQQPEADKTTSDNIAQTSPLITVYMPTWNREKLAIRAIQSILRQDYECWQLIIVDDCSPSFATLGEYIASLADPRITYIRNDYNSGACAVRNQAINMAQGTFIAGIDDDDEWLPNRLSSFLLQRHKLQQHAFLYADDYLCDKPQFTSLQELHLYPKPAFTQNLFNKKNIVGNQVFTLTERLQNTLFDARLSAAQDYDAFYRLAEIWGAPYKVSQATQILYVNHGEARITGSRKKFSGYYGFYKKHKNKFDAASKKYQLFTLYYIRNKPMSVRTLMALFTLRNVKRYLMLFSGFRKRKF